MTELWLVVTPTEPLALLPSGGYVEDYFSHGSQLTLRNITTNVRLDFDFSSSTSTSLSGNIPLSSVIDGVYVFEGWIQDLAGNNTIIGSVQSPSITAVSAIDVALRITSNLGTGVLFDVSFHNQKPVNINVEFGVINKFETKFVSHLYYNTEAPQTNKFNVNFTKQLYFNLNLMREVDPLLP